MARSSKYPITKLICIDQALQDRLNDYIRRQRNMPSANEAIRDLLDDALTMDEAHHAKASRSGQSEA
jgi:metal-responsive CopG/Arc/MetJ family transcriptional regulator